MAGLVSNIGAPLETMSLNSIVAGFSFASAFAWMDVVRWLISQVVHVTKNSGQYYIISALFATLIAVVVYMIINALAKNVKVEKQAPISVVTR